MKSTPNLPVLSLTDRAKIKRPTFAWLVTIVWIAVFVPQVYAQYSKTISPDKDADVVSSDPNTNYGTSTLLAIQNLPSPNGLAYVLIHFNLSAIPSNAIITGATLNLVFYNKSGSPATTIAALESSPSWTETGVTWNNMPKAASAPTPISLPVQVLSPAVESYEVSSFVEGWYDGTYANNGFQLSDGNSGTSAVFYSRESSQYRPYLTVSYNAVPPAPSLSSPSNGTASVTVNPILNWNSTNGAASYHLQVCTNSNFSSLVIDQSGITGTSQQVTGLTYGHTYYWRVSATNATGTSSYSTAWSFSTLMNAPTLVSPSNGSAGISTSPTLQWNSSADAASYRLQVSSDPNFSSRVYDQSGLTGTSRTISGLSNGTTYYWRVNASGANATSAYSDTWSFSTTPPPSSAPTLVYPSNRADNVPIDTVFSWNASSGATSYHLQISTNSSFSPLTLDKSGITGTSQAVSGLTNDVTYFWHVSATGSGGTGSYSSVDTFTTIAAAPGSPTANPATNVDTVQFTASWSGVSGADSYRLDVATDTTFANEIPGYQELNVGNVTIYNVSKLSPGTTYYYRVRAHNAAGNGNPSNTVSLETIPRAPEAIAPDSAKDSKTSFIAKWDSVTGAEGYRLDVSTESSFASYLSGYQNKDVGNVTSYKVTGAAENSSYSYRVRAYDKRGGVSGNSNIVAFKLTSIQKIASDIPSVYTLSQNFPNPFNPSTDIEFALPKRSFVRLSVFDVLGREVSTLVNGELFAGHYRVEFNASRLVSGIYFYRLIAGSHVITKRMLLLK